MKDRNDIPDGLNCLTVSFTFSRSVLRHSMLKEQVGLLDKDRCKAVWFQGHGDQVTPFDLLLSFYISQSFLLCQGILGRILFTQFTQSCF